MFEIAKAHPDLIVFVAIMVVLFFVIRKRSEDSNFKIATMEDVMNFRFRQANISGFAAADIHLEEPTVKLENKELETKAIGTSVKKGYDFFHCVFNGETQETIPWHRHKRSKEFFYIINGSLHVTINGEVHLLTEGEHLLVEPNTPHLVAFGDPCNFIVITKPPLFSRIGKFYDKLLKAFS